MYFLVAFEKISRPLFTEHPQAGKNSKFNKVEAEWIKKLAKNEMRMKQGAFKMWCHS